MGRAQDEAHLRHVGAIPKMDLYAVFVTLSDIGNVAHKSLSCEQCPGRGSSIGSMSVLPSRAHCKALAALRVGDFGRDFDHVSCVDVRYRRASGRRLVGPRRKRLPSDRVTGYLRQ